MVETAFFDTTVLLAGLIDMGAVSEPAQAIMGLVAARKLGRPMTAWHCCLEFYAVGTRLPEDLRLTPAAAAELIEEEILGRLHVVQLPETAWRGLIELARMDAVVGGRVYDLHIAEVARRSGAKLIVSDNRRHFAPLLRHGIRVLTAAEFAAERRA
jgi:hypothetical protein